MTIWYVPTQGRHGEFEPGKAQYSTLFIWPVVSYKSVQLRDPKNDFIFNFNFDDKVKDLWTVWILRKINQHYSNSEKMSWANAHLNLCKLLETELRLAQLL